MFLTLSPTILRRPWCSVSGLKMQVLANFCQSLLPMLSKGPSYNNHLPSFVIYTGITEYFSVLIFEIIVAALTLETSCSDDWPPNNTATTCLLIL